jgi:hypothetical protein
MVWYDDLFHSTYTCLVLFSSKVLSISFCHRLFIYSAGSPKINHQFKYSDTSVTIDPANEFFG